MKNDVIITLQSDQARHLLKNIWSIEINTTLCRVVPGHFQKSHIAERNRFVAKFSGFSRNTPTPNILEALKVHDARNAYYPTDKDEVHVEFPTEQLMIKACIYSIHIRDMHIKGIPREGAWSNRDKFLAKH